VNYLNFYFYNLNPSGSPILPHLLRQMPYCIADYSGTASFLYLPVEAKRRSRYRGPVKCLPNEMQCLFFWGGNLDNRSAYAFVLAIIRIC